MFAHPPSTPFRQTGYYTPSRPSPLGQRSTNISTPPWTMSPTRSGAPKPSTMDENANTTTNADNTNAFLNSSPIATSFQPFNIQSEPIIRHTNNHQSPITFNAPTSTSNTPFTSNNPFTFPANTNTSPPPHSPTTPTRTTPKPKFEARYASTIANPLKNAPSLARSKTRKMFLNRVRNERDSGRFEARGEQMMRMECLADRRRWEESMAADGEVIGLEFDGEFEGEGEDDMLPDEADALDEFISQEEAMEMALRETQCVAAPLPGRVDSLRGDGSRVPFSDDEYDDIFMGLSDSQFGNGPQDMDMS